MTVLPEESDPFKCMRVSWIVASASRAYSPPRSCVLIGIEKFCKAVSLFGSFENCCCCCGVGS